VEIGGGAYTVLVGREPEGKRALGRARRRWEDNIKMDLKEVWWNMDWIDQAEVGDKWLSLVNVAMDLQVPLSKGKVLVSLRTVRSLRRSLLLGSS